MCVRQTLTGAKVEFVASTCLTLLNICSSTGSKCGKAACNGSDFISYSFFPTQRPSSGADGKSQSACLRLRRRPVRNVLNPRGYTQPSSGRALSAITFLHFVFLLNFSSTAVVCQCSCCGHFRLETTPNYPSTQDSTCITVLAHLKPQTRTTHSSEPGAFSCER